MVKKVVFQNQIHLDLLLGFDPVVKNLPASAGDARYLDSIPGLGRSPGGGHGNRLQYSCPENPMDRAAWQTSVRGAAKESDMTQLLTNKQYTPIDLKVMRSYLNGKSLILLEVSFSRRHRTIYLSTPSKCPWSSKIVLSLESKYHYEILYYLTL